MDDNFKHRLKNWVDKREAQNRMRMKDITHVVDPGRIIPKEDKEVEDHNYYSKKIREYIQKRLNEWAVNKSEELNKKLNEEISKLHDDWTENNSYKDRDKLHSKMMLPYNSKERNAMLKDLQTKVPAKIINGEKHYLLHRRHEPIKGNFVVHNQTTSYSTFPKEKMSEILGGGHIHSAWIPESKISYSFEFSLPYHAIKPNSGDGEEGEIIVGAGKYPIHENFFQTSTMSKPIYSSDSGYPIKWPENLKSNEWAVNKSEELDKGAKGDWQKEGYTFKYIKPEKGPGYRTDMSSHQIEAFDKNNNKVGSYTFFEWHEPESIGSFSGKKIKRNPLEVWSANTQEDHKRKGLASEAYKIIENITGKKVYPGGSQTKEAKALWSQPSKPFGKKNEDQ